jgi:hypothetical protein
MEKSVSAFARNEEFPGFSPFFMPEIIVSIAADAISRRYGLKGINYTVVTPCASSNAALIYGLLESAYEECLYYELDNRGLEVKSQLALPLVYKEVKLGSADFSKSYTI